MYEELDETKPDGLRYATLRLDDGVSFVHLSESESDTSPLTEVPSFKAFQKELADRADEEPVVTEVQVVGSYGFGYADDQRLSRDRAGGGRGGGRYRDGGEGGG